MKVVLHDRKSFPEDQRFVANLHTEFNGDIGIEVFHGRPSESERLALYTLLYVVVVVAPHHRIKEFSTPVTDEIKRLEREAGHRWPFPW